MDIKDLTLKNLATDRPDLVDSILVGEHEGTTKYFVVQDSEKNITKWTEEKRDLDGKLISKRVDDYTYYENRDIGQISLKRYNDKNVKISEIIIGHNEKVEAKKL